MYANKTVCAACAENLYEPTAKYGSLLLHEHCLLRMTKDMNTNTETPIILKIKDRLLEIEDIVEYRIKSSLIDEHVIAAAYYAAALAALNIPLPPATMPEEARIRDIRRILDAWSRAIPCHEPEARRLADSIRVSLSRASSLYDSALDHHEY